MERFQRPQPVLDLAIDGDVLHRPRTIKRHQRHDILDAGGLHAPQRIHHARAFNLEHRDRLGLRIKLIGGLVIERDVPDVILCPGLRIVKPRAIRRLVQLSPTAADQVDGVLDHGQRLQAQKVELHKASRLNPFHVELGGRHVRPRVLIERHQLVKRPVPDHHARSMGRGVPQQAFDLHAVVQQPVHHLFRLGGLAQARLVGQRLLDRDGFHPLDRDHLRQPVHLPIGHLQHPAHVAHRGLGQKRPKGDDLTHLVAPVLALHISDHLFPAIHAEVDIEVGHRHTFRVQEPLEQKRIAQGI